MSFSLFIRNLFWTVLCPGTVTLFLPWYFLWGGYTAAEPGWHWQQWAGLAMLAPGMGILLWCIYAFARHGKGTLSPLDPARRLVVQGLYRYVRNPMYVGVMLILLGEALFFRSLPLLGYAAVVFAVFNLFIRLHEEPHLRRQFGDDYARYCRRVRRWIPGKAYMPERD